jgi:chromosome segregation ATPase
MEGTIMRRFKLLGLVFGVACFATPGPAYANGKLEDARATYSREVTEAYKDTVKYLEASNTDDGGAAVKKLREATSRLVSYSIQISNELNQIEYSLQGWEASANEIAKFFVEVEKVEGKVGREQVRLDDLRSKYESAGAALEKSNNALGEFGKRLGIMKGTVRSFREKFSGPATNYYKESVKYLEAQNIVGARDSLMMLKKETILLQQFSGAIDMDWETMGEMKSLTDVRLLRAGNWNVQVSALEMKVGKEPYSINDLTSTYEQLTSDLDKAESTIAKVEDRFKSICDTCR